MSDDEGQEEEAVNLEPVTILPMETLQLAVELHNECRQKHGAPPVKVDEKLCEQAQRCAQCIISNSTMETDEILLVGRNVFRLRGPPPFDPVKSIKTAIAMWYNKMEDYNWEAPLTSTPGAKLFSQLIWKSCTTIGVGVESLGTTTAIVVLYTPPGNLPSERRYKDNVLPLLT